MPQRCTLHDRIAAAIREVDDMRVCKLSDADIKFIVEAVIRELKLRPERWKSDDPTMLRGHWTRYVTDWTHPDA